jgi:hypothetical protein
VADHLIDAEVDVDAVGCGRMADDNLLTDLLILSSYIPPSDGMDERSRWRRIREQDTLYSTRSISI